MPHGLRIYTEEYETAMATMFAYPPSQHSLPHWKCVLLCCDNLPHIKLPG